MPDTPPVFDDAEHAHLIAVRGEQFVLVRITMPSRPRLRLARLNEPTVFLVAGKMTASLHQTKVTIESWMR